MWGTPSVVRRMVAWNWPLATAEPSGAVALFDPLVQPAATMVTATTTAMTVRMRLEPTDSPLMVLTRVSHGVQEQERSGKGLSRGSGRSPTRRTERGSAMSTTASTSGTVPDHRGRVRVEHGTKRVRAFLGGELVADTIRPLLVWEVPYFPAYYFPADDVRLDLLTPNGQTAHSPSRGDAVLFDVKGGETVAPGGALRLTESPLEELRSSVRLDWQAMDHWFEEDEEVFVHPRDPHTRVDILASSRHVEIVIDGVTVATSDRARLLFETGLPTRYYLPLTDVRMDLLRPSSTVSSCPYKGDANYYSLEVNGVVHEDAVWTYRSPVPESQKVQGLVSFYNERVDIVVDGVVQERPRTKFS